MLEKKQTKKIEEILTEIDLEQPAPAEEPMRQYYFMEKARRLVKTQAETLGRPLTFHVTTFGCQMNARDSEKLTGILEQIGYVEEEEENQADFVIYNTCTVRENANQKVYGHLGQLNRVKKKNPHMLIGLCGCMMQEPEVVEKLKKSYRFVDLIFGTHNIFKFAELVATRLESDRMVIDIWKDTDKIVEDLPSERKFSFKSGVNIMFGCNNFCSYCIVPYVRGRERSRNPKDIIREIESLVADGVVEVMLLGQNVNSYGKTLEERYFANATNIFTEREAAKILKKGCRPEIQDVTKPLYNRVKDKDAVTKMQYVDLHLWLVHDILMKGDKMGMANSLEVRVPFLDRNVLELAESLPLQYKVQAPRTKVALRAAAERSIRNKTAEKKKLGFPIPIRVWLKEEKYYNRVRAMFASSMAKKFFNTDLLMKMLEDHRDGKNTNEKADDSRKIWTVYIFLVWYDRFFEHGKPVHPSMTAGK